MRFARTLPRETGFRVFSAIGGAAGVLLKKDRQRAMDNLGIAFPEMAPPMRAALTKAMFKRLGENAYEFLNLEGRSESAVAGLVEAVEGREHIEAAYNQGKGVIAVTGHIGCWELLAAYFASEGYTINVVGRELWEKRINHELVRIRESVGYRTIDREGGGKEILRILRDKGIVAILMDQHTRVAGLYVPFFNRPAHTPTGVAKLTIATGVPILPMAIYMTERGKHVVRVLAPIERAAEIADKDAETERITRECSRAIEDLIRFDPKQWVWFHRRWRDQEKAGLSYATAG